MCIYGLLQAASQYHKKMISILRNIGFEGSSVDLFLVIINDHRGLHMVAIYVDDKLLAGHPGVIGAIGEMRLNSYYGRLT